MKHINEYNTFYSQDEFVQACRDNNLLKVIEYANVIDDVNAADENGWIALHMASHVNALSIVKVLVENGAKVDSAMRNGWTALMFAAESGNLDVVKYLVQHGADVNIVCTSNYTATALEKAMNNDNDKVFKYLLAHPDTEENLDYIVNTYIDLSLSDGVAFDKEIELMQSFLDILDTNQDSALSHEERLEIINML